MSQVYQVGGSFLRGDHELRRLGFEAVLKLGGDGALRLVAPDEMPVVEQRFAVLIGDVLVRPSARAAVHLKGVNAGVLSGGEGAAEVGEFASRSSILISAATIHTCA
ncbi:hypothetical protein [Streptomyces sp. BA2]|uniref:hypothetical protein n=1 Tax=Streptomyces sp. BA2 TaxID=436595 RepID=UPI0013240E91|nr:hypothetical protein [Streptomyces sp. BA2]MWA07693.1 hypothetical protein [Streptomyces sp. BA2]